MNLKIKATFSIEFWSIDEWFCTNISHPQARKLGEKKTVEALARQFQDQIERIMMEKGRGVGVEKSYIPSRNEREVNEFKKLNREKSFDEARTAVQSQIEKIFQKVRQNNLSQKYLTPILLSRPVTVEQYRVKQAWPVREQVSGDTRCMELAIFHLTTCPLPLPPCI